MISNEPSSRACSSWTWLKPFAVKLSALLKLLFTQNIPADDASFSLPIIRENNHRILERSSAVTNRRRFLTPRFNRPFAAQKQITRQQIWERWSEPPWYFIINQLVFFFQDGALVARRMRRHRCDPILNAVAYEFSKRVSFRNAVTPSPFT